MDTKKNMATLKEYYNADFNRLLSFHEIWKLQSFQDGEFDIIARVHLDFDLNTKIVSFYIPPCANSIDVIKVLLGQVNKLLIISDSAEIQTGLPGEQLMNSKSLIFSGRIFFYTENYINHDEFEEIKNQLFSQGLFLHYRDMNFSIERSKTEKPIAFISHDSRDKDDIASKIALGLQKRMCFVWYDEYSLAVGASLRESIEKGLKECKKCVLVLSPNFLSNTGWTKVEFNSIFTREILETKNLVLPVWCGVSKEKIYEYCPTLLDRVGLHWDRGEEFVVNKLHQALIAND